MPIFPPTTVDFRVVAPGSSGGKDVTSSAFAESAALTATIANDSSGAYTVAAITTFRTITTYVSTEGDLPGKPKEVKSTQLVQVGKSDGKTPLSLNAGDIAIVAVGFEAPAHPAGQSYTATLDIVITPVPSGSAATESIPLTAIAAIVSLTLPAMTATQHHTVDVPLTMTLAGPQTTVGLSASPPSLPGVTISISPPSLAMNAGTPGHATLHIAAALNAAAGEQPLGIYASAFDGWEWWFPSSVNVQALTLKPSPIDATYAQFATLLGAPTAAEAFCDDYVGQFRAYANGAIYWSGVAGKGAFEIDGPILIRLRQTLSNQPQILEQLSTLPTLGLGYPTSNVTAVFPSGRAAGMVSTFDNGSIYWGPTTAACIVLNGAIDDAWKSAGGPVGSLGFPIEFGSPALTPVPPFQCLRFENGLIYLAPGLMVAHMSTWNYTGQQTNAYHQQTLLDTVSSAINKAVNEYNSSIPPPDSKVGMKDGPFFPGAPVIDYTILQNGPAIYVQNRRYGIAQYMFGVGPAGDDAYFTVSFDLELDLGGNAPIGTPDTHGNAITAATANSLLVTLSNVQCVFTFQPAGMSDNTVQQDIAKVVGTFNKHARQQISLPDQIVPYLDVKTLMNGDFAVLLPI